MRPRNALISSQDRRFVRYISCSRSFGCKAVQYFPTVQAIVKQHITLQNHHKDIYE